MEVHLIDGTYELFRHFYSPAGGHVTSDGREVGATRGVLRSLTMLLRDGATHVGVATDHVIESFRNAMFDGYKDGSGVDPVLSGQFTLLEDCLRAAGFTVWAMVDQEADDALAAAAHVAAADDDVTKVLICTPDKDLGQCLTDPKVLQFDRRNQVIRDAAGVREKYGVDPASIPDWLALVGDTADGIPGISGWGAKTAAAVLTRYGHLEDIPDAPGQWDVPVRGVAKLAATLAAHRDDVMLYRDLATLRTDAEVGTVAQWRWTGMAEGGGDLLASIDALDVVKRLNTLQRSRT